MIKAIDDFQKSVLFPLNQLARVAAARAFSVVLSLSLSFSLLASQTLVGFLASVSPVLAVESSDLENNIKAAEQGNPAAQYNLGLFHEIGQGLPQDYKLSASYYLKAAKSGFAAAQNNLAYLYKNGMGVPRDSVQAAFWYQKAANQGFTNAQFNLAVLYEFGQGVKQNYQVALNLYKLAADKGVPQAQANLAVLYENGLGVEKKEFELAEKWYRSAAEQGDGKSQNNLGVMYSMGKGVDKNLFNAYFLFSIAVAGGYQKSTKGKDYTSKALSIAELTKAQTMVVEWKVGNKLPF